MVSTLYLPALLLTAVLGTVVGFFAWARRDRPGAMPLTLFVVVASVWALAEGMSLAGSGLAQTRAWKEIGLICWAVVVLAWFLLVLEYTDNVGYLTRPVAAVLVAEPIVFAALLLTGGGPAGHGLVVQDGHLVLFAGYTAYTVEFGLGFWAHQVYTYGLVAAGSAILVATLVGPNERLRSQATALLGAITMPMIGNALYVFGVTPPGFDPAAIGFTVAGVALASAILRSDLLSITPITRDLAREHLLSEMDDQVIAVSDEGRIVDANPAAAAFVGETPDAIVGRELAAARPALTTAIADREDAGTAELERNGEIRHYDVVVSRLYRSLGAVSGRVISLRDVTERRQREQRLDVLNRVLRHNLRNELNVARGHAELVAESLPAGDDRRRLERVTSLLDTVVERADKVGQLSRSLEGGDAVSCRLDRVAEDVVADAVADCPDADLRVDVPAETWVVGGPPLRIALAELVANAVEHNDGSAPTVRVGVDDAAGTDDQVVVTIADDGPGVPESEWAPIRDGRETPLEHGTGVGLWLVTWIVEGLGGAIGIENSAAGCTVSCRLPRAEKPPDESDLPARSRTPSNADD